MKKRSLRVLAAGLVLATILADFGTGAGCLNRTAAYAADGQDGQMENRLTFDVQESNTVAFGEAEDWNTWDNMMKVIFPGDGKPIAVKSELCYTMTIDEEAYKTMKEEDYIKLQAIIFQEENNWDTAGQMGYPTYRPADFTKNADGTYSAEGRMELESGVNVFQSLLIRGVGTGMKGKVTFSGVSLDRAIIKDEYVTITEPVTKEKEPVDVSLMAGEVKLVDAKVTDSTKALAAYLLGVQKSGRVLFGHQDSSFNSVHYKGEISDSKDVTGAEPAICGIDTLALAGCETRKNTRQEALEASIAAAMKAYEGGSLITVSCHMPNFTNQAVKATGDETYPYDFTSCNFQESQDLTPCADYILEGGEYNPQFRAYLDIIVDFAKALQGKDIPILFRPFHENTGGWFWWGTSTSIESFRSLWRYTIHYLEDQGVHNLLYVYSPAGPISDRAEYMKRYPGDAYVDILAFDYYDNYLDPNTYTGDEFFKGLGKSCQIVAELAAEKQKIPAIAETGVIVAAPGRNSLLVSGNPTVGHDWYNKVLQTAADNKIPYFLLWANFGKDNFFVPFKETDTTGHEMINDFISFYNKHESVFGNETNFYTAGAQGAADGAMSRAGSVKMTGYSTQAGGYMIAPKDYAVIKEPCRLKAYVKNASQVEFAVKTSDSAGVVTIPTVQDGNIYTGELTSEILQKLGETSTGIIICYVDGQELGRASFVNFNKDIDVLEKGVFENFEYYYGDDALLQSKYGAHNSAADCSSSLSLNSQEKAEGNYSGAFHYVLSYNGSEVWTGGLGRVFDSDKTDLSDYNAVSMWVKPDGNGQKMVVQINDNYEAYLTEFVKGTKAQYVTIPFDSFKRKDNPEETVDPADIRGFKLWCNSVPENFQGTKDENGNYKAEGTILFDDIKAVKISSGDLAKANAQGLILSDQALTDFLDKQPEDDENTDVEAVRPGKTVFTSIARKSKSSKKVVLKWKRASKATGYQIYMAEGKNGTYKLLQTIKKKNITSYTTKSLKKNITYAFKIRAYRKVSGKTVYGAYSKVKSIKIK